jgi:uncharacterized protein (DUF433 family)
MSDHAQNLTLESVIKAFGADHVIRLTGLSKAQLRYWDNMGFFEPAYAYVDRRSPYSRIYSFKDVVGLRVLSLLRMQHKISLARLRKTADALSKYSKTPWSDLVLYVLGREVYFDEPETGKVRGVLNMEYTTFPLISVIDDIRNKSLQLRERTPEQFGQVEKHRFVAHNARVIAGTRIPINAIRRLSDAGYGISEIKAEYPTLTDADVEVALRETEKVTAAA